MSDSNNANSKAAVLIALFALMAVSTTIAVWGFGASWRECIGAFFAVITIGLMIAAMENA